MLSSALGKKVALAVIEAWEKDTAGREALQGMT